MPIYPDILPDRSGALAVGDGQLLHWQIAGRLTGQPVLVLHGGPGSGLSDTARRFLDPAAYRIVQFDQRGAGRSTPHASESGVDLTSNTTAHQIADIERLREHLGIARWLVLGGSWGATLALAYALAHPERVKALVLYAVTTTSRREIDWITRGVGAFFPEAFARFLAGVPVERREGDLSAAYGDLLMHPDPKVHEKAAQNWCDWEVALAALPGTPPHARWQDARFRLGFARLVTHYWRHGAWLAEWPILSQVSNLTGLPGVLIHGRLDLGSPLMTAWELAARWPGSELVVVEEAGHDSRATAMAHAVVAAIDRFRT